MTAMLSVFLYNSLRCSAAPDMWAIFAQAACSAMMRGSGAEIILPLTERLLKTTWDVGNNVGCHYLSASSRNIPEMAT